jgi:hypothetical protein
MIIAVIVEAFLNKLSGPASSDSVVMLEEWTRKIIQNKSQDIRHCLKLELTGLTL